MTEIPNQTNTNRKQRTTGPISRMVRCALLVVLAVAILVGGMLAYYYFSSATVRHVIDAVVSGIQTPEEAFPGQDSINVLLMGRDVDRDPQGRVVDTRGRADTTMLAHIDFRNRRVGVLSIPRDTLVHIPGYTGKRRISYANALGGPELARATVHELLGVEPDYYILVNFEGFEKAIDAIGGLQVVVDKQLDYDDNWGDLHIHLRPGKQVLSGRQAMGFVRYRRSNDGDAESDFVRIQRQQLLLCAAREKLSSPGTMFKVPRVLDIIEDDIEGDLTPAQMMCLARFMKSLPPDSEVRTETLPALDSGSVFVRADVDATRELVQQMFFGNRE